MYVAIGNNAWGRGRHIEEAVKNARKNTPTFCRTKSLVYDIFQTDDDHCYVDEFGRLRSKTPIEKV